MRVLAHSLAGVQQLEIFSSLKSSHELFYCEGDGNKFFDYVQQTSPKLIILSEPDFNNQSYLMTISRIKKVDPEIIFIIYVGVAQSNTLIEAIRLGMRDVVTPENLSGLSKLITNLESNTDNQSKKDSKEKIIAFISAKGGDGSSSVLANFAWGISDHIDDRKALLIDMSLPFGDLDVYLTKKNIENDLSDYVANIDRLDVSLLDVMTSNLNGNLDFIKSPASIEKIMKVDPESVGHLIDIVEKLYDYLLIDLGSAINPFVLEVVNKIDHLYIVFSDTLQSARKVGMVLSTLHDLGFEPQKISVVINKREKASEISIQDYQSVIKHDIEKVVPLDSVGMRRSVLESKPLMLLEKKSPFVKNIDPWVREFLSLKDVKSNNSLWQKLRKN